MCSIFSILTCDCTIRVPYGIKKVIKNISINILGHEGKDYDIEVEWKTPSGVRVLLVRGVDIRSGDTWNVLGVT